MSMRTYAFWGYGLLLNGLVDDDVLEDIAERDIVDSQCSFDGEAFPLRDDGTEDWDHGHPYGDDAMLYYICMKNRPMLFQTAYKDMDELVEEMYEAYADAARQDKRLPELARKQVRERICAMQGTYYC